MLARYYNILLLRMNPYAFTFPATSPRWNCAREISWAQFGPDNVHKKNSKNFMYYESYFAITFSIAHVSQAMMWERL